MIIFKGDTRECRITIADNGTNIDPATLTDVKAWIYEYTTGTVLGKWSTTAETGYGTMTASGDTLLFAIAEEETESAAVGQYIIQVSFKYADVHAASGYHRISKKGILGYVRDAKY